MILLDSNIIIYLRDPAYGPDIMEKVGEHRLATSNIVVAEVLGFGGLSAEDSEYFDRLFSSMKNFPFDGMVTRRTIEIRKSLAIQMPDAIIAASAIENSAILWTHNQEDFKKVPNLQTFDPIE